MHHIEITQLQYNRKFATENHIAFDDWLCGPGGAGFCLYPIRGVHTEADLAQAKNELYRKRDVVSMTHTWAVIVEAN
ncbi:hypothetical protein [Spirosoma sordidisoli]|uniref:Uncharacterized protein n=1 Tax=Spirosoma sordidisoli TaxID=2502893 RepID=A0A4Q2UDL2_9BACT|nr:hypothetical protein [Spirosoma sordidisoli]RYC66312.1 hypothetical protein EQG79_30010 [Spirosoma sordidisoli]